MRREASETTHLPDTSACAWRGARPASSTSDRSSFRRITPERFRLLSSRPSRTESNGRSMPSKIVSNARKTTRPPSGWDATRSRPDGQLPGRAAYQSASSSIRRQCNQFFFDRIEWDGYEVTSKASRTFGLLQAACRAAGERGGAEIGSRRRNERDVRRPRAPIHRSPFTGRGAARTRGAEIFRQECIGSSFKKVLELSSSVSIMAFTEEPATEPQMAGRRRRSPPSSGCAHRRLSGEHNAPQPPQECAAA